ncbi:hypothetical protein PA5247_01514 [Pseudomonas aeruginosa]
MFWLTSLAVAVLFFRRRGYLRVALGDTFDRLGDETERLSRLVGALDADLGLLA